MCGCYACNLCSLSETYDFAARIFPVVKLKKAKQVELDEDEVAKDYYVHPREFVE